jgi:hypothetical protein
MSTAENPHAGSGMVALDIGDAIGALVVSCPQEMDGAEIEICPAGRRTEAPDEGGDWWQGDWRSHSDHDHSDGHSPNWPHVSVIRRPVDDGEVHAAVFPGLQEGEYELWRRPHDATALTVWVERASVASVDWPTLASPTS